MGTKAKGGSIADQLVEAGLAKVKAEPASKKPAKEKTKADKVMTQEEEATLSGYIDKDASTESETATATPEDGNIDDRPTKNTPAPKEEGEHQPDQTDLDQLKEAAIAATLESAEEDEGRPEDIPLPRTLFLPYRKCHACLHLQPTMPADSVFKGEGIKKASGVGAREFDCITEATCPARGFQMLFDPIVIEDVEAAFVQFVEEANMGPLAEIYTQASDISEASLERVHAYVTDRMADIQITVE